jgi:hypothetical protein
VLSERVHGMESFGGSSKGGIKTSYPHMWRKLRAGCDRLVTVSRLFSSLAISLPSGRIHELPLVAIPIERFLSPTPCIDDSRCMIEFMHQLRYNHVINSHWPSATSREHHA